MRHPGVLLKIDEGHEVIPLDDEVCPKILFPFFTPLVAFILFKK